MPNATRFDLAYDTMPWHKVDAVVFDIGNVLIHFAPDGFVQQLFPGDAAMQRHMLEHVFHGPYWADFDRGTLTYEEAAARLARQTGGREADYLHALYGWIELKTPIDEGWRAVRRCRRAGKRLYLLSNYPREGYARLREKFADLFQSFDGGCISFQCHHLKPEEAIYLELIDSCGLEPSRTLFIDDTLQNVEGALNCGLHGFHMHESGMLDRFFI